MKIPDMLNTIKGFGGATVARLKEAEFIKSIRRGPERGAGRNRDIQLILYIAIIILVNVMSLTLNFRIDLTRSKSYSLTHKSREIVHHLKENLKVKVLFTRKDLPAEAMKIYRYLKDLLDEYDYYGNEYFSYEIIDDADLDKEAEAYGIRPMSIQDLESDQVRVMKAYMGLVVQQSDLVEKVEALNSTVGMEYAITSLIEKMSGKIDGLLKLKQPIQVMLFMDSALKTLPIEGIDGLDKKIKDAVDRCNINNYDKLRFGLIDPAGDKDSVKTAEAYGVQKLSWKAGVDRIGRPVPAGVGYLGLVLKNANRADIIDIGISYDPLTGKNVMVGLNKIEDRINYSVGNLVSTNPRIGYVTGHGEVGLSDPPQSENGGALLKQILSDVYDVKEIDLSKDGIPEDLALIIVDGPVKEFSARELYRIDQFLMKGKAAIFLIDSFNEINLGQQNMFARQPVVIPVKTGLEPLLGSYGITVKKDVVLDTNCAKGIIGNTVKEIYHWPIIKKGGFDRESVITKYLRGLAFAKASSIDIDGARIKKLRLERHDLVKSSAESWLMEGQINLNPFFMTPPEKGAGMKSYTLAALVSGKFESYFKDKDIPPAGDMETEKNAPLLTTGKLDATIPSGTTRVLVVGTSEITRTGFLSNAKRIIASSLSEGDDQSRLFANAQFIHSMADCLTGRSYIPEMSSKSLDYNPLDKISNKKKIVLKALNIGGVPLMVVIIGFFIWNRRAIRKKRLFERFSGVDKNE